MSAEGRGAAGCVAYVVYSYPAVSQTFISREVAELRALGWRVDTFSLHRTPPEELLDDAMRAEAAATPVLLPLTPLRAARAELRVALRRPGAWWRSLARARREAEPGLRGLARGLGAHALGAELAWTLRRRGVRHVHTHFAGTPTHVASFTAELLPGGSWSLTVHGPVEFMDVTLLRLAERVREARFAATISDLGRAQLLALTSAATWERIHVVRCGIDPARFPPPPARAPEGPLRVLTVARLVPVKGQAVVLDAMAELARRGVVARLTVVGDGPLRPRLEAQAAALGLEVAFTGSEPPRRVRERCAEAEVFCLPSFAEGIPIVLMEALATELPVVATRVGGIPELVRDGESGLLVSPARPDQLADALERLAGDPALRLRLGRAGREQVLRNHDARRSAQDLAGYLHGAVGRPAHRVGR